MAVWGALQIAVKRREAKSKGEKERYKLHYITSTKMNIGWITNLWI